MSIILQLINYNKREGKLVHRICLDENGALAHSSKFLWIIITLGIAIETTIGYKSTSNSKVEQSMQENHKLTKIALLISNLPTYLWYYIHQYATYIRYRILYSGSNHIPYFIWYGRHSSAKSVKIQSSAGIITNASGKLTAPRTKHCQLRYRNYEMTYLYFDPSTTKIVCSPYFIFNASYSTILSYTLPSSYHNIMGNLLIQDAHNVALSTTQGPFLISSI